jgi:hypothetical protein
MGILADFFLAASDADAAAYDGESRSPENRIASKGITPLEASTLLASFQKTPWDVSLMDRFVEVSIVDEGEQLTHRLPDELVAFLAEGSPDEIAEAVKRWAATEEMGCSPSDVAPLIGDLVRLARRARKEKAALYLWNCV